MTQGTIGISLRRHLGLRLLMLQYSGKANRTLTVSHLMLLGPQWCANHAYHMLVGSQQ